MANLSTRLDLKCSAWIDKLASLGYMNKSANC